MKCSTCKYFKRYEIRKIGLEAKSYMTWDTPLQTIAIRHCYRYPQRINVPSDDHRCGEYEQSSV